MFLEFQGCCSCDENQFLCKNKKCVPQGWTCNGIDDCGDKSDELPDLCKGRLLLLYLIYLHYFVEFIVIDDSYLYHQQIGFFSDIECEKGYFTCSNKVCIPMTNACDGNNDCGDNSDENEICKGNTNLIKHINNS